jgi:murein DD-endopeptidase MepM/ murein hydrolase activator NlpD
MMKYRPLSGELHVVSPFGAFEGFRKAPHTGVDLRAPVGTLVYAPNDGVVRMSDSAAQAADAGGVELVLQLDNGFRIGFAHLSEILPDPGDGKQLAVGDRVVAGQPIAKTGASGRVTGPHLHVTLRDRSAVRIDAMPYFKDALDPKPLPREGVADVAAPSEPAPRRRPSRS